MTNAEARCNKSLRPRKPEGSLGRTAQDVHFDSHTAPELCKLGEMVLWLIWLKVRMNESIQDLFAKWKGAVLLCCYWRHSLEC